MFFDWLFGRRRKLLAAPFPAAWESFLALNCRHFPHLPAEKQQRIKSAVNVIAAERTWVGVSGLIITDEIKATIAAQASLLLLGVDGYYFDKVSSILLHQDQFERRATNSDVRSMFDEVTPLVGEAHQHGSIVLSWPEALAGARGRAGGSNLVLHEFAHHIDSLDGDMGGTPPLASREIAHRWRNTIDAEYERLVRDVDRGRATLLDAYGSIDHSEFFAVATECFYERPRAMGARHPKLFDLLRDFYQVDPSAWWPDADPNLDDTIQEF